MHMVSQRLKNAVKLSPKRAYVIAHEASLHPTVLSRLLCGIEIPKFNDARVIAIGKVLGLGPSDCFETGEEQ